MRRGIFSRRFRVSSGFLAHAIVLLNFFTASGSLRAAPSVALPHEAYIWQRTWTPEVGRVVRERGRKNFARLVALSAELSWEAGRVRIARAQLDYESLKAAEVPIGLALRIGPFPASLMRDAETPGHLASLAAALVAEARAAKVEPAELQLDFDCAESKLDSYRAWVEATREKIAPVPLAITVLPCWLDRKEFAALAHAADGLVVQVHSLELPKTPDAPFTLCDPQTARAAVEKADKFGVPFRVALPTYGYLLAFSAKGQYLGLSADGPLKTWPEGSRLVEARADAPAIAALVRGWTAQPPKNLQGFIWYRLPTGQERMNWPWETLQAVMQGRAPRAELSVKVRRSGDGLAEVELSNVGETDLPLAPIELKWNEARLTAADGLNGYELLEGDPGPFDHALRQAQGHEQGRMAQGRPEETRMGGSATLRPIRRSLRAAMSKVEWRPAAGMAGRILPGQTRSVGWLRLDRDVEVTAHVPPAK